MKESLFKKVSYGAVGISLFFNFINIMQLLVAGSFNLYNFGCQVAYHLLIISFLIYVNEVITND